MVGVLVLGHFSRWWLWVQNPLTLNIFLELSICVLTGCHVAAHAWATWYHHICPNFATCPNCIGPILP